MKNQDNVQKLSTFTSLEGVPWNQLEWLADHSQALSFKNGEYIGKEGDQIQGPHFLLSGKIRLFRSQQQEKTDISFLEPGAVFGYLPYSRSEISFFNAEAYGEVEILSYSRNDIRSLIVNNFELTQSLVHVMNNRVRDFTTLQQQNSKMAALGKLAAGLAHELNNPSAAIVSDAVSLREHLKLEPEKFKSLTAFHLTDEQVDRVNTELHSIIANKPSFVETLRERERKESEIIYWLERNGIEYSYEMGEVFAVFNIGLQTLENIKISLPDQARATVFNWINNVLVTEKLVDDIQLSASRISELITSVKIYTHMDRGMQMMRTDIHLGIRNTLQILGHKIRGGKVTVHLDFDNTLPQITANPGELNQVWTNIIDNALDSMKVNNAGNLVISTELEREYVKITLSDDGPGISQELILNIFDPFFTTKEVGKGTGMGLETVRRIIHGHRGEIKVDSVHGRTVFEICLPINPQEIQHR